MKYINEVTFEAVTAREIKSSTCRSLTGSCEPEYDFSEEELKTRAIGAVPEAAAAELAKRAAEQGITATLIEVKDVSAEVVSRYQSRQYRDYTERWKYGTLKVRGTIVFESDQPAIGSPVAVWLLYILKWLLEATVLIVVAWFAVEAVKSWLVSMTTSSWDVHTVWYDEEGNKEKEEWESGRNPAIGGIGMLIVFAVIMAALLLFWFSGIPKGLKKGGGRKRRK